VLEALIGPNAPDVSINEVTGEITVRVGDSDGVTGIAIYDGSTNVIDPSQGNSGFVMMYRPRRCHQLGDSLISI